MLIRLIQREINLSVLYIIAELLFFRIKRGSYRNKFGSSMGNGRLQLGSTAELWLNKHINSVCIITVTGKGGRQKFCTAGLNYPAAY